MARNDSVGFDITRLAAKMSSVRFSINDSNTLTPTLAKVVLTMSGTPESQLEIRKQVAKLFQGQASVVEGSFRWADREGDIKTAVGFVRANTEVREYEEKASNGKYRVMSANLLMDQEDSSLWEVKEGAGTRYLCRQGNEDLSSLVALASNRKASLPKLSECASAVVAKTDFVAFVDTNTEEVRYGFAVQAATDGTLTVVASDNEDSMDVEVASVIDVMELEGEDLAKLSETAMAPGMSKEAMIAYYRKAYSYAPEYIAEIIKMIDMHAFA